MRRPKWDKRSELAVLAALDRLSGHNSWHNGNSSERGSPWNLFYLLQTAWVTMVGLGDDFRTFLMDKGTFELVLSSV